jgi:hypothetical protein
MSLIQIGVEKEAGPPARGLLSIFKGVSLIIFASIYLPKDIHVISSSSKLAKTAFKPSKI